MHDTAILSLITTIVFGHAAVTYLRGLRRSIWIGAGGCLLPWLLWIGLVVGAFFETGVDSDNFRFTLYAGVGMVAILGSLVWLVAACFGALLGAIARRVLPRRAVARDGKAKAQS